MFSKVFKHKGVQAPLTLSMVFLDECRVREEIKVTENLDTDHVFGQKRRLKKNLADSGEKKKIDPSCLGHRC